MKKPPGTGNSQASSTKSIEKKDVVSVACQTDNNLSPESSQTDSSLSQNPTEPTGMVEKNENTPSSIVNEQRSAGSVTTTETKPQTVNNESICEGTISMTIGKFSTRTETMCSGTKMVQGVPWRIMVVPKQHVVQKKQQKCMGFFLQCCPDKIYSDSWSCKAEAEMRLLSKKPGVKNFVRKTSHLYSSKENDWGYSCFMTWADVLDENQGYIKDDKVSLEITVRAEPVKNLMSRDEFVKAVDQWYNLAEMQMKRGLLDLSLEANAQGFKFCKDKDDEMKAKLEEQKQRLVNKKLLDSINRIENHGTQPKSSEPLKPTSLRQALTGAQKTIVSKNCKAPTNKRDRKTTLQQIKKKKQETAAKQEALTQLKTESKCETNEGSSFPNSPRYSVQSDSEGEITHPGTPPCCHSCDERDEKSYSDHSEASTADDGDDDDYSDYYNEDDIDVRFSEHDEKGSISGYLYSLDEKVESGSQTEFVGDRPEPKSKSQPLQSIQPPPGVQQTAKSQPQAAPRRDKVKRHLFEERCCRCPLPTHLSRSFQRLTGKQGASPDDIIARFHEEIDDKNSSLFEEISASQTEVTAEDQAKIDAWCVEHFGDFPKLLMADMVKLLEMLVKGSFEGCEPPPAFQSYETLSEDLATCGLTIGLCTINSRRCAEISRELRKLIYDTFGDEYIQNSNEAIPNVKDSFTSQKSQKKVGQQKQQPRQSHATSIFEQFDLGDKQERDVALYPISESERSIEHLVQEIGLNKFNACIVERLHNSLAEEDYNTGLVTLVTQLFNYFRTLSEQKYELEKSVEIARALYEKKIKNGGLYHQVQLVTDSEKIITESQELVKSIGATWQADQDKTKKLEAQLFEVQNKLKVGTQQIDTLTQQLKEARNLTKKVEKKVKQEESKKTALLADKLDLEEKLKTAKKEIEQLKKKSNEERNIAKKQKDRDDEVIRRLESENAEKEREKNLFEGKLKEARAKESKAEREKKQALSNLNSATERIRAAEAAQIPILYAVQQARFEKVQEKIHTGLAEAEKNFKRYHSSMAEQESVKKNFIEWKAVHDELDKIIKETKTEYDNAYDLVKKGHILFSQLELSQPNLPVLPKALRTPPVQVVQPSTSTIPPPTIVTPPAGVIGQPRVNNTGPGVIGQPTSRAQTNVGMSSSSYSSMKLNRDSSGTMHTQPLQQLANSASLWNWSDPMETFSGSVFGVRPAMERVRPQPLGMDNWSHQENLNSQGRSLYSSQHGQAMNWTSTSGWQRSSSSSITQEQQQYNRSGLPPYYQ